MDFIQARQTLLECDALTGLAPAAKAQLLMAGEPRQFTVKELVFKKGEHSRTDLFLVISGKLAIISDANGETLVERGPGEIFGEIGIFHPGRERTATVIAEEPTEALVWDFAQLDEALRAEITPALERVAFERIASDFPVT